jgi:lysozyme
VEECAVRFVFVCIWIVFANAYALAQDVSSDRVTSQSLLEDFGRPLGIAPNTSVRPLISLAFDLIKEFEGWSATAYDDPAGYCTIGYGHLISLQRCSQTDLTGFPKELSRSEGDSILEKDTESARWAVQSLVSLELTDHQFGALSSFVFNIGKANFGRSTVLKLLNSGHPDSALLQMARWIRAKDQILAGLVERRACEIALFRNTLGYNRSGRIDRTGCRALGIASDGSPIDIERGE